MSVRHKLNFSLLAIIVFLSGCASFGGSGLTPGTASEADVRRVMGEPAEVWPEPAGGKLLSYPRGPMGVKTYMVRLDGNGRLTSINQVLDERYFFGTVQRGMSKEEISRLLGPPGYVVSHPRLNETAWDYRYRDSWNYASILSVVFDADGKVKSTVTLREGRGHEGKK